MKTIKNCKKREKRKKKKDWTLNRKDGELENKVI